MVSKQGDNLIFIVSQPRCGSTLVSTVLGSNEKVYCPPEPWFLLRLASVYGPPMPRRIYDDYFATVATKALIDEDIYYECARDFATKAYNSVLERNNKEIFIDKTPRYYHILDFIERLFPTAKKVWLKRDPLDVASSYKSTWGISIETLSGKLIEPPAFDFILGLHALEKYFNVPSSYKYEVRYEDIVNAPESEFEKLCSFCGIRFSNEMLHYGKNEKMMNIFKDSAVGDRHLFKHGSVHSKSVRKWHKNLDREEITKLLRVIGLDIFTRMGYNETADELSRMNLPSLNPSQVELEKTRNRLIHEFNSVLIDCWEKMTKRQMREMLGINEKAIPQSFTIAKKPTTSDKKEKNSRTLRFWLNETRKKLFKN